MTEQPRRAAFNATGILSVIGGAAIFALVLWNTGPAAVWEGVTKMQWWLLLIVLLGGLRFLVRAIAWSICVEPPHRLPIRTAFAGVVAGDTVGNATPLGPVLGEPAKAAYAHGSAPVGVVLTALAIENLFYTLSAAAMIAAGTLALLFAFDPPTEIRSVGRIAVAGVVVLFAASLVVLWRRPAILSRLLPRRDGVRALEQEIYTFASRRRGAVLGVVGLEILFHALGVLEAHITLTILSDWQQPPLLTSFIIETAHRLLAVLFKVVPFQLGVGELGTAAVTVVLGLGRDPGVTLAVIQKARRIVWALVGVILLVRRRVSPKTPRMRI